VNVPLDPADERELEKLAHAEGKEPGTLLRELVHQAISDRKQSMGASNVEEAIAQAQHEEWERLDRALSGLPVSEKAKGFSGRDHDEILYGWRK
jgi:hypothetical protein